MMTHPGEKEEEADQQDMYQMKKDFQRTSATSYTMQDVANCTTDVATWSILDHTSNIYD